jgi:hypothetical protein
MRVPCDNADALDAFIANTAIGAILARMIALSAQHFNRTLDAITGARVAILG